MLILLLLAEVSAPLPDNMTVRKATMNMARCVQSQIDQLDDGISDARTVAQGATAACSGARGLLRRSLAQAIDELALKVAKKSGEPVSDAEKTANVEEAMSNLDESIGQNSVRWVLQKRAADPAPPKKDDEAP